MLPDGGYIDWDYCNDKTCVKPALIECHHDEFPPQAQISRVVKIFHTECAVDKYANVAFRHGHLAFTASKDKV